MVTAPFIVQTFALHRSSDSFSLMSSPFSRAVSVDNSNDLLTSTAISTVASVFVAPNRGDVIVIPGSWLRLLAGLGPLPPALAATSCAGMVPSASNTHRLRATRRLPIDVDCGLEVFANMAVISLLVRWKSARLA